MSVDFRPKASVGAVMDGLDKTSAYSACEALCMSVAELAEQMLEKAATRPSGGVRGYGAYAASFQRASVDIAAIGAALAILARSPKGKRGD